MSALADVSDFLNVHGRAEESTESDAESLDFLSDPQQEIPAFQEARMSLSTDFLQGALEELSASEEGENPGRPGEIQHKEASSSENLGVSLRVAGEPPGDARVAKFVGPNPQRMPEPRPRPSRSRRALLYVSLGTLSPSSGVLSALRGGRV